MKESLKYKTRDELEVELKELKSRTCENCKHMEQQRCNAIQDWDCYNDEPCEWCPPENFSCNKWEQK